MARCWEVGHCLSPLSGVVNHRGEQLYQCVRCGRAPLLKMSADTLYRYVP
ncbi:hypothetical protein R69619_02720 [Paraburkholderia nemoris]|nr:hypothetical protein R69619_02720 [Paraburkholderia nemoris]